MKMHLPNFIKKTKSRFEATPWKTSFSRWQRAVEQIVSAYRANNAHVVFQKFFFSLIST